MWAELDSYGDIKRSINQEDPLMILSWFGSPYKSLHWCVIKGYEQDGADQICINDPKYFERKLPWELHYPYTWLTAIIPGDITFNSTDSDGYLFNSDEDYSWVRTAPQGNIDDTSNVASVGQDYDSGTYGIKRALLYFNTSSLASWLGEREIKDVKLKLYGSSDHSDQDFYITVVDGQPTYPHDPMDYTDYYLGHYRSGGDGNTLWTSGWTTSGYNTITLNAYSRSWINKTGTTKLCLASNRDIYGSEPWGEEYVKYYTHEKGGNYQPQLVVSCQEESTPVSGAVTGEVRDVNHNLLSDVEVSLYEYGGGFYGGDVASSEYSIEVDQTGDYWLLGTKTDFYEIDTADMPHTQQLHIDLTTQELLDAGYMFNFSGNYGLVPKACTIQYAMKSINLWVCAEMLPNPEWGLSLWKAMESIHSWQSPN